MKRVEHYFSGLTDVQKAQFERLPELYSDWNSKINVISRQDIENLEERHILHSLAIARAFSFKPGARLLDLGTGGGFPGIPLAIFFPEVHFTLIDGTGKKIRVVQEIAQALGLQNVDARHARAEEIPASPGFDFVLSRGVTTLDKLLLWSRRLLSKKHRHAYPNGIIALKGGNLQTEIAALPGKGRDYTEIIPVSKFFEEAFFAEKAIVYIQG